MRWDSKEMDSLTSYAQTKARVQHVPERNVYIQGEMLRGGLWHEDSLRISPVPLYPEPRK